MTNIFLKLGIKTARRYLKNMAGPNYRNSGKNVEKAWSKIYGVSPTTLRGMARERLSLPTYQNRLSTKKALGQPIESWDNNVKRINDITKKDWPLSFREKGVRADRHLNEIMAEVVRNMNR